MLDTVSKLSKDFLRNIRRTLGHEIYTYSLASYEPYNLLDLVNQSLGSLVKEHMSLVKEEDKLRQFHIADFRKLGIEFGKKPQKECRIQLRIEHQLVRSQHIHHSLALFALEKVVNIERWLSKKLVRTLILKRQQGTLYGSYTLSCDVTV